MTRGKLVYITKDKVFTSTEFNGDMYPDGHGAKALWGIMRVESESEYRDLVERFNKEENFNYPEQLVWEELSVSLEKSADFSEKYFDNWFSDWLYIKNGTSEDIIFTLATDDKQEFTLKAGKSQAFNFGSLPSEEDENYLKGYIDAKQNK